MIKLKKKKEDKIRRDRLLQVRITNTTVIDRGGDFKDEDEDIRAGEDENDLIALARWESLS